MMLLIFLAEGGAFRSPGWQKGKILVSWLVATGAEGLYNGLPLLTAGW